MKYLIDTDILIYFLKNNERVAKKMSKISSDDIVTSIINYTELLFGAYNSLRSESNLKKFKAFLKNINVLDFDKEAAEIFARQKTKLKKDGNIIADMDLMIASICLANNVTLVTNNLKHFNRIEAL
ncbi:MAG: type II toxin-antitoxin system VapC family toxin, partial [bacterium]|nr:type II toxin-antitoxin system VapC family toxin [bacterium]